MLPCSYIPGIGTLDELLGALSPDPHSRGREFEKLAKWFLENDPAQRDLFRQVWSFTKVRFSPSRLLLAVAALLPIAHYWWVIVRRGTGAVLVHLYWFDATAIQFVLAALAGVAVASGLRPKGSHLTTG